jgi:hypothetical protein
MIMKLTVCTAVLVLLAGSNAFGITIQNQVFNIGSVNGIDLTQGMQSAQSNQNLTIDLSQIGSGSGLMAANVSLLGITGQTGGLFGGSSLLGISSLGVHPMLGTTGLLLSPIGSLQMVQTRALLLGHLLAGY